MQQKKYSEWITEWLSRKERFVKKSTFAAYSNIVVNHLLPHFGNMYLSEFSENLIQNYALKLLEHGRLDGAGGLCDRSSRDIIVVLKNTLRDAMKAKLLSTVSYEIVFPPVFSKSKVVILEKKMQQMLIQSILLNLSSRSAAILLSLYTGLRIGEICALKWSDIDCENKLIRVNQTLQRVYLKGLNGKGKSEIVISEPKTRSSKREVPISVFLYPIINRVNPMNADAFFVSGTEKCVEVRTFRAFFENFLVRHNMGKVNFHTLRHTFATRCIEFGADCKTVSEILGHSSVSMTLNLYVHPQIEQKRRCVEMLSEVF